MMDIASGLRWVQREIAAFGGDPNRVTVMGQSSAGQGVEVAMTMPEMEGLFHGVISESTGKTGLVIYTVLYSCACVCLFCRLFLVSV
jgi:para-nitrobenzyl esterase